ncbi:MAG: NUDIX hydrolase [Candidatus Limnocylindrales bacterium]
MTAPPDELVLCIPRVRIPGGTGWRGVREAGLGGVLKVIDAEGTYRPRSEVERDPTWTQIIPYVVVRAGGSLFLMQRTRMGSDARLHDRYSIGVGGHVNPEDGGLAGGLQREWAEELVADWLPEFDLVGLLNDDTDPVGAVHLGIVYVVEAAGLVGVRETDKLQGAFATQLEVDAVRERLETWSELVFDHLTGRKV